VGDDSKAGLGQLAGAAQSEDGVLEGRGMLEGMVLRQACMSVGERVDDGDLPFTSDDEHVETLPWSNGGPSRGVASEVSVSRSVIAASEEADGSTTGASTLRVARAVSSKTNGSGTMASSTANRTFLGDDGLLTGEGATACDFSSSPSWKRTVFLGVVDRSVIFTSCVMGLDVKRNEDKVFCRLESLLFESKCGVEVGATLLITQ